MFYLKNSCMLSPLGKVSAQLTDEVAFQPLCHAPLSPRNGSRLRQYIQYIMELAFSVDSFCQS